MRTHLSAQQVADLKLPRLPASKVGIIDKAKREGWPSRKREDRGGGQEYCVKALLKRLPRDAHDALLSYLTASEPSQQVALIAQQENLPTITPDLTTMADWQRRCADARAVLLGEVERRAAVMGVDRAIGSLVDDAQKGELRTDLAEFIPAANARGGRTGKRTLSYRTVYRWRGQQAERGWAALLPAGTAREQPIPAWAPLLLKFYRTPMKRSLAAVLEDVAAALPSDVPAPSYGQARRFLQRMSVVDRNRGRHGPNGLLKYKAHKRRSTEGLRPLDVVTADGHAFKADVAHPRHGQPFRPEVCVLQDVATRYVFGWSAGLAESSQVVMDACRSGIEHLGLFGIFYTDNGAGFVADAMTADVTGFLARIHATPMNSLPGRAQARGKIERLQATLWKRAARKLPTYNGRDMDNEARRKVVRLVSQDIKERGASRLLLSWQEFLEFATAEIAAYNNRPHRSLPKRRDEATGQLRHMSPSEALDKARADGWAPEKLPADVAADLWRPYELRTTRRGEVSLPWGRYFHHALVPFGGEQVRVGYDIHDGSRVWVRTAEGGKLICIAERDGNVIPEQPMSKVEHAREKRSEGRLKLLRQHEADILAERGPALIDHQPEEIWSPALDARQKAIEAELLPATGNLSRASATVVDIEGPTTRFLRAQKLEARLAAGEDVDPEDADWLRVYRPTSEYRALRAMYEDFGEAALQA